MEEPKCKICGDMGRAKPTLSEPDGEECECTKEPGIMADDPNVMRGVKCNHCAGDGWTAEHDPDDPHENGCSGGCPIQVQCEKCKGTGYTSQHRA